MKNFSAYRTVKLYLDLAATFLPSEETYFYVDAHNTFIS